MAQQTKYTEDNIRSLDWKEHIRMRPGMYIGKLGDGSSPDDGIYILLKEVLDNSIDEYVMGAGKTIEISIRDKQVTVRDYGRGIPLGKVVDVVSKMNTGGKYDSKAFKKSVGLNGVGTKAVNALSDYFKVQSIRENKTSWAEFNQGNLTEVEDAQESSLRKGTKVQFIPDESIFGKYKYRNEYVAKMLKNYVYLNTGLTIVFNGEKFHSENGLKDLLEENTTASDLLYPIIHLKDEDIEIAITHSKTQYSEEYHSFVNGQHTTQGGTHQAAFREAIVKTVREYFGKTYESSDIRKSIISAIAIKVMEPVFESQTKTKLEESKIKSIKEQTYRGVNLTSGLNEFAHTTDSAQTTINIFKACEKMISITQRLFKQKGVSLSLIECNQPFSIVTDPVLFQMVLFLCIECLTENFEVNTPVTLTIQSSDNLTGIEFMQKNNTLKYEDYKQTIKQNPQWQKIINLCTQLNFVPKITTMAPGILLSFK